MIITDISNLGRFSKVIITAKCDTCDIEKYLMLKLYTSYGYINGEYLCRKCKSKKNNLEKYGVENVFQLESVKNKSKNTIMKKYGCEFISQSEDIKEKIRKNSLEKYGETHHLKNKSIYNKLIKTNLEKYGVENVSQSDIIKQKKIKTCNYNFGVDYISKHIDFKEILKKTYILKYGVDSINKCEFFRKSNYIIANDINYLKYLYDGISSFYCDKGHTFEIHQLNYHNRIKDNIPLCTVCYPIGDQKSIKEKELLEFIKSLYSGKIISGYRDGLEIDIYLPELKIGLEFNGIYYHSSKFKERNYHLDKTNYFKEKDIRIIHIWEDDWDFRKEIVKSQISNILKINLNSIFARKCLVKEVVISDSKLFLDNNHIQGSVSSSVKIGLYFEEELVSIMTFNNSEGRKKMEDNGYNLNRFCNLLNTNVIGSASKLLSFFTKNYNPSRIVSYADKDWSIGNIYEVLGFKNVGGNGPDYKYIINGKRIHKSRYRKSKLRTKLTESEEMNKNGFLKVYDCGKIKFELKNDNY